MATILAVVCLAACGGGGEDRTAEERYMDGVCAAFAKHLEIFTAFEEQPSSLTGMKRMISDLRPEWRGLRDDLRRLDPPDDVEELHNAWLKVLSDFDDMMVDVEKALESGELGSVLMVGGMMEGYELPDVGEMPEKYADLAKSRPKCIEMIAKAESLGAEGGTPAAAATPTTTAEGTVAGERTPSQEGLAPGSLSGLDSYRYSMTMDSKGLGSALAEGLGGLTGQEPGATPGTTPETVRMEISGAFVAPDKAEVNISIGGLDEEMVVSMTVIGDQQWWKWGDMVAGPDTFEGDLSDMSLAEAMWGGFSESGGLTCASEKKETVNGVPSLYCGVDEASFEQLSSLFGGAEGMGGDIDDLSLDMWLAEDGDWPVRLRAHVAGTDESGQDFDVKLEMDITDINEEIDIEPPS